MLSAESREGQGSVHNINDETMDEAVKTTDVLRNCDGNGAVVMVIAPVEPQSRDRSIKKQDTVMDSMIVVVLIVVKMQEEGMEVSNIRNERNQYRYIRCRSSIHARTLGLFAMNWRNPRVKVG